MLATSGANLGGGGVLGSATGIVVNSGGTINVLTSNTLLGQSEQASRVLLINQGGLVVSSGGVSDMFFQVELNGGTLAAVGPNSTFGDWTISQGILTPGTGRTSYLTGGNMVLGINGAAGGAD